MTKPLRIGIYTVYGAISTQQAHNAITRHRRTSQTLFNYQTPTGQKVVRVLSRQLSLPFPSPDQ